MDRFIKRWQGEIAIKGIPTNQKKYFSYTNTLKNALIREFESNCINFSCYTRCYYGGMGILERNGRYIYFSQRITKFGEKIDLTSEYCENSEKALIRMSPTKDIDFSGNGYGEAMYVPLAQLPSAVIKLFERMEEEGVKNSDYRDYYMEKYNRKLDEIRLQLAAFHEDEEDCEPNQDDEMDLFNEDATTEEIVGYYFCWHKDEALRTWLDNIRVFPLDEVEDSQREREKEKRDEITRLLVNVMQHEGKGKESDSIILYYKNLDAKEDEEACVKMAEAKKGILVVDMPENCEGCNICKMLGVTKTEETPDGQIPERCPIKPIPQEKNICMEKAMESLRKSTDVEDFVMSAKEVQEKHMMNLGYNSCLKDIFGNENSLDGKEEEEDSQTADIVLPHFYENLKEAVMHSNVQDMEDFLGYQISSDVLEEIEEHILNAFLQMPHKEVEKFLKKYGIKIIL